LAVEFAPNRLKTRHLRRKQPLPPWLARKRAKISIFAKTTAFDLHRGQLSIKEPAVSLSPLDVGGDE
jgi:hypothetical protein